MDLHKDRLAAATDETPPQAESAPHRNVRITRSRLVLDELAIIDDDRGSDPYNNTGAHCILKSRDTSGG